LRRYLDKHGEEPDGPLVTMVPISVRSDDKKDVGGNQVAATLCSLATDVDDPTERLQRIHESMVQGKQQHETIGADTLQEWVEFAAPAVVGRAARLYTRTRAADRHRPVYNVTISNVPGPPFPLYSIGARMVSNYPVGPVIDGVGLNMTVMSYLDQLDFGLQACPDVIPDVWTLAEGLEQSLDELVEATGTDTSSIEEFSRVQAS
jgi:diacylglycerol O-acyltransferase / wax synthase